MSYTCLYFYVYVNKKGKGKGGFRSVLKLKPNFPRDNKKEEIEEEINGVGVRSRPKLVLTLTGNMP